MTVTLRDVAQKAGVSLSTVSRVMRDEKYIDEATRQKVLEVAEILNYRPDLAARRLRYGRSFVVGFVVQDIANPFFSHAIKGVERFLHSKNQPEYELIITNTGAIAEREINAIRLLLSRRVEGIILASTQTKEALDLIHQVVEKEKIPLVSVDNRLPDLDVDVVSVNSFEGAYMLTRHLLLVGYQRIAIITGPQTESHARDRLSGYKTALEEAGIVPDDRLIGAGNWEAESGYALTAHWLSGKPPEAIFACNNFMGMGALSAMHDSGVTVPDDIALVSFDDVEFGYLLQPALTTLKYSWQAVGEKAIKLLLDRLEGQEKNAPPRHIDIPFELLIRDSCGAHLRSEG